jgi:hypothetical protein
MAAHPAPGEPEIMRVHAGQLRFTRLVHATRCVETEQKSGNVVVSVA